MNSKSIDPSLNRSGLSLGVALLALAWLLAFSVWFYQFEIPNNHIPRWMFWAAVPFDLMDLIDPPRESASLPWSWFYLLQRIPFLLIAFTIWAGAWGIGSLVFRVLKLSLCGAERLFFSLCLGLACVSLVTLLLGVCGLMFGWLMIVILVVPCVFEIFLLRRRIDQQRDFNLSAKVVTRDSTGWSRIGWFVVLVAGPFVACQLLGAMSPQTDFDVVEYHLGGPKEWYQAGRIARLPHNVYTSFPFLAEMLVLSGMIIYGDWQWGALAGQAAIAGFAPLTALGIFAAGRRWFTQNAGWLAALIYLTSPWTYRISIIAYVEGGLSCYLFAALFAALLFRDQAINRKLLPGSPATLALLSGLMAGSAMACKYTGLLMVVIPAGLLLIFTAIRQNANNAVRTTLIVAIMYSAGVLASIGPWLLKNTIETGNPVYPLGVRLLGGKDRTEELDVKWRHGHAAKSYASWSERLRGLGVRVTDVMANNDWHSPLMFGMAPLSLFLFFRRRSMDSGEPSQPLSMQAVLTIVWLYVVWQFLIWFCLTHQIDRFYVPMFSAVALLAGAGSCWWEFKTTAGRSSIGLTLVKWGTSAMILSSLLYNADIMIHGNVSGFNAGRLDLNAAQQVAVSPRIAWLNQQYESGRLPQGSKVLCVGEALMFHATYPYLYNTVFDHSIFEQICAEPESHEHKLRPVEEIREGFRRSGITHIDVNWAMILMYREPDNYGFTDFVNPDCFAELQRLGILGPPLELPYEISLAPLSDQRKQLLADLKWDSRLIKKGGSEPAYISAQVFPVIDTISGESHGKR